MMMTAVMAVARDAEATSAPMRATQGGGLDSSGTAVQGGGEKVSKIAAATAKKVKAKISAANKAKAAADTALAADAATAPANATAAADVLEISRQRVVTRSAASIASPSSAATKNPGKNLYIFIII